MRHCFFIAILVCIVFGGCWWFCGWEWLCSAWFLVVLYFYSCLLAVWQLTYYGHINRADNILEKLIMQGKIEGKRGRGRPATKWFDNIKTMTTRSVCQLNKDTKDRAGWRRQVHNITRGRTT